LIEPETKKFFHETKYVTKFFLLAQLTNTKIKIFFFKNKKEIF